jgi:hypothetical protein
MPCVDRPTTITLSAHGAGNEHTLDDLRLHPGAVVSDDDASPADDDREMRRYAGFLGIVERVVDRLLDDHQRPLLDATADLADQFLPRAKFEQTRGSKCLAMSRRAAAVAVRPQVWRRCSRRRTGWSESCSYDARKWSARTYEH